MDVSQAVAARRSVRGFADRPVDPALLRELALKAARAPSGGNLQPWHIDVVAGDRLAALKAVMRQRLAEAPTGETPEYDIYPPGLADPYRTRRFAVGEALYGHVGIPREDKAARRLWFADNFRFFGAPAALFATIDRRMGPPQWSDLGMYLQSFMLLAVEAGLGTCPQECWAIYPETVRAFLEVPAGRMIFAGMAIGYEDPAAPANRLRTDRSAEGEWLTMRT